MTTRTWAGKKGDIILYRVKSKYRMGVGVLRRWKRATIFNIEPNKMRIYATKGSWIDLYRDYHEVKVIKKYKKPKRKREKK